MTGKDELNDLLGNSDDEEEEEVEVRIKSEINNELGNSDDESILKSPTKVKAEANHVKSGIANELLGNSDDDNLDEEKLLFDTQEARNKDLDHILGVGANSSESQVKTKTSSVLAIPETYEISQSDSSFFLRTPNFIKIQSEPFDLTTHSSEIEKLQFGNTTSVVRWRYKRDANGDMVVDKEGNAVKESNAKLIKWDDGTYQLVVGDSVFNAKIVAADSCYVFEQQKSIVPVELDEFDTSTEAQVRESSCLECIGDVQNRIILQPSSIQSETHAKMSLKISDKFKKEQKITVYDYEKIKENPMKTLNDLARKEEEQNRRDLKLRQQADYRMGGPNNRSFVSGSGSSKRPSMSADYLNDESQFEGENLAALKKNIRSKLLPTKNAPPPRQPRRQGAFEDVDDDMVDDDEEEDNDEMEDDDDEDEEDDDEQESENSADDEEAEEVSRLAKKKMAPRTAVESDDDELHPKKHAVEKRKPTSGSAEENGGDDEEQEFVQQQQRKRAKRAIVESDDEE